MIPNQPTNVPRPAPIPARPQQPVQPPHPGGQPSPGGPKAPDKKFSKMKENRDYAFTGFVLATLLSVILGAWGITRILEVGDAQQPSYVITAIFFMGVFSSIATNMKELAAFLRPTDGKSNKMDSLVDKLSNFWDEFWKNPKVYLDMIPYYVVDVGTAFAAPGGLAMIISLQSMAPGDPNRFATQGFIFLMLGVALTIGIAGEWAGAEALRLNNLLNKKPEDAGFAELRIKMLTYSGWLAICASGIANVVGMYIYITTNPAQSETSLVMPLTMSLLISLGIAALIQVFENILVRVEQKNIFQLGLLGILWIGDAWLVFVALGGYPLAVALRSGNLVSAEATATLWIAVIAKLFVSYQVAVSAEITLDEAADLKDARDNKQVAKNSPPREPEPASPRTYPAWTLHPISGIPASNGFMWLQVAENHYSQVQVMMLPEGLHTIDGYPLKHMDATPQPVAPRPAPKPTVETTQPTYDEPTYHPNDQHPPRTYTG